MCGNVMSAQLSWGKKGVILNELRFPWLILQILSHPLISTPQPPTHPTSKCLDLLMSRQPVSAFVTSPQLLKI